MKNDPLHALGNIYTSRRNGSLVAVVVSSAPVSTYSRATVAMGGTRK
jgi:hypothetical protein